MANRIVGASVGTVPTMVLPAMVAPTMVTQFGRLFENYANSEVSSGFIPSATSLRTRGGSETTA